MKVDLKHPNTMVAVNNPAELAYMQAWFETNNMDCGWMGSRELYPIALSFRGGWTDHMDRALYYVPFSEFIKEGA